MAITCRTVTNSDLEKLLNFMAAFYKIESIEFNYEKSMHAVMHFLSNEFGQLRLIEMDGAPIGYYCIAYSHTLESYGRDCFLDEIYIEPLHQREGIGTKIMESIEAGLKKDDFKAIHLIVHDNNNNAFDYYIKNGFRKHKASFMTKAL